MSKVFVQMSPLLDDRVMNVRITSLLTSHRAAAIKVVQQKVRFKLMIE